MRRTKAFILTAIVSLGLLASLAQASESTAAEKLGWRLGPQAFTFRKLTFFETVDKAQQLGLKYIEMYPGQKIKPGTDSKTSPAMTVAETTEVQAKLKEAGVKLVSFGVAPIPAGEAEARQRFEWAKQMGIEVLVTQTMPNPMLDKLSGEFGIKIALHNHPKSWPPEKILAVTKDLSARIGSCSDTGHWKRGGLDTVATMKKLEGRIIHSHFKDVALVADNAGKWEDVPWGAGQGNAAGMLAELMRQGFKGYLMIEYENGTVEELMRDLPKCIEFFNQTAARLSTAK
jgi:sugar phosphate isomerase/epimerase